MQNGNSMVLNTSSETEATALNSSNEASFLSPANSTDYGDGDDAFGADADTDSAGDNAKQLLVLETSPDRTSTTKGHFASWLASQEFDASEIIWNGDDVNPQDLSGELQLPHEDRELEAASAGAGGAMSTLGRSCEYSPGTNEFFAGETIADEGTATDNSTLDTDRARHWSSPFSSQQKNHTDDDDDDDGHSTYVSLSDMRPTRSWPMQVLPTVVTDVYDKVISPTLQCWSPCNNESNTDKQGDLSKMVGKQFRYETHGQGIPLARPPPILRKSSYRKTTKDIKKKKNEAHVKHSPSSSNMKNGEGSKKKPMLEDSKLRFKLGQNIFAKPSSSCTNEGTSKPAATSAEPKKLKKKPTSTSSQDVEARQANMKTPSGQDIFVSRSQDPTSGAGSPSKTTTSLSPQKILNKPSNVTEASSTITPLVGEDITDDGHPFAASLRQVQQAANDITLTTINSCTYSASPGRMGASMPTMSLGALSMDPFALTSDYFSTDTNGNNCEDVDDSRLSLEAESDTPLMHELNGRSSDEFRYGSSDDMKLSRKKNKGRRRRRMILNK